MQAPSPGALPYPLLARNDQGVGRLSTNSQSGDHVERALAELRAAGLHAARRMSIHGAIEGGTGVEDMGGGWQVLVRGFSVVPGDRGTFDVTVTGVGSGRHRVSVGTLPDAVREVIVTYAKHGLCKAPAP